MSGHETLASRETGITFSYEKVLYWENGPNRIYEQFEFNFFGFYVNFHTWDRDPSQKWPKIARKRPFSFARSYARTPLGFVVWGRD